MDEAVAQIPRHQPGRSVLSFCFADPYGLDLHFDTVRTLAKGRAIDFLILPALGMDANRNWRRYMEESTKLDDFLGDRGWRDRAKKYGGDQLRLGL